MVKIAHREDFTSLPSQNSTLQEKKQIRVVNPNVVTVWLKCVFPLARVSADQCAAWTSQGFTVWPCMQRDLFPAPHSSSLGFLGETR